MVWTIIWVIGLAVILLGSIARSGFILGLLRTLFGGIGWTILVGIIVLITLGFGAVGSAMEGPSGDEETTTPPPSISDYLD